MARRATSSTAPTLAARARSPRPCWTRGWCNQGWTDWSLARPSRVWPGGTPGSPPYYSVAPANRTRISPMSVRRADEPVVIMDAEERFEGFENLMPFKGHNILLVSSLYDSFILREDGRLNELLIDQSLELSPQQIPGITHVSSCSEALALARTQPHFNLIVTNLAVGDMNAAQLAAEVRSAGLDVPVVVLAYDYREVKNFIARNPITDIERIFLWQG